MKPGPFSLRIVLPLLLLLSLTAQSTLAQDGMPETPAEPTAAWNIQFVDASPYIDKMTSRSLAFRPSGGYPCIAFGGDHLYYSCKISGVWNTEVADSATRVGEYAALAFNSNSRPYISYYDVTNKRLKLAYKDGATWVIKIVPNHPAVPTMLEEDSTLFEESPEQIVEEGEQPIQGTDNPLIVPEQPVQEPDQPVQEPDQPLIETFEQELRRLLQPWLAPLLGSEPDVLSPEFDFEEKPGVGKHTSVDVDYLNRVHITYLDDVDSSFWYVRWTGGTDWAFKLVDYYNDRLRVGLWSSVVIDDNLGVHMSYMSEKYDSLKYAHRKPSGGWSKCTVDGKAPAGDYNWNSVGSFSSIAMDDDNNPHISYYDLGNKNLKHAWMSGSECKEINRENFNHGWKTETVDSDGKVGWWTSIAITGSNGIYISYYDASTSSLKYAYRSESGSWRSKKLHKGWGNNGHLTSIALTSSGKPAISYFNAEYGYLQYTECKGSCTDPPDSNWYDPSNVYNAYFRDVGLATSLAVKSDGAPFISYLDTSSGYLKYAQTIGSFWWKAPVLTSINAGLYSSIQLYNNANPRIAFYDTENQDLTYAALGSSGWSFSDVDTTYDVGQYVSMAMDSNNQPHMSYYDATQQDLVYAYRDTTPTTHWVTDTLDAPGNVGLYTSIVLDAADKPYISYYDATHNSLKYAFKTDIDAWKFVTVDDDPTDAINVGLYTSIIVKGTYQPYITYYDKTNGDLKYAWSTDSNGEVWNIDYVDNSLNDVGMWSSLERYPADDSLHVCYYDATDDDLMYAKGTGAGAITWAIQKVDTEGDVGLFCSVGLTGAGLPEISYYDNSGGDLKIAFDSGIVLPAAAAQLWMPIVAVAP